MAKINEQTLTIKLSQLLKNSDPEASILNDEDLAMLIEALKSMVGDAVLIELD
jgi:hypothetical protein